jgi:predicted regulator of Ras-like GTPase activity (Roadblock/LC7/MglB family)
VRSDDVMRKPFAAEELVQKIDGLLAANPRPAAPAPAPRPEPSPAPRQAPSLAPRREPSPAPYPTATADAGGILAQFGTLPGVHLAVLVDREGFVIESTADAGTEAEIAGALTACLVESSDGIGRELGQGALQGMILEYEKGMVLLYGVGAAAMLAIIVLDATALGKVRYYVKKALPELVRAI